jgi:hypothetical protein
MLNDNDMNEAQYRMMQEQSLAGQINSANQSMAMQEVERGMVKEQLDMAEDIERISHLLRGESNLPNLETGQMEWVKPKSSDDITLSEHGIAKVLNFLSWYLNKNTLLSNYDEETIMAKMEDSAGSLADALFMSYEKYFRYPTEAEIDEKFITKMRKRQHEIVFAIELRGRKVSAIEKEQIYTKLILETNIDVERRKLKEQTIKDKLKGFDLLIREIQDAVHSAYNRAYKGMERRTLREHIHITENTGGLQNNSRQQGSGWSPLNWLRKN